MDKNVHVEFHQLDIELWNFIGESGDGCYHLCGSCKGYPAEATEDVRRNIASKKAGYQLGSVTFVTKEN